MTPGFIALVAADLRKWTYNPNQSRAHGQFTSGTGQNIVNGDVVVSGHQGGSIVAVKPINAAAAAVTAGRKPVNPAAARLTPQVRTPPPKPAPKPKPKPAPKPKPKPAPKPTPGPEAATRSPHTAIGSHDGDILTVGHRTTAQTAQADARRRAHDRAVAATEHAELEQVRAALAASHKPRVRATQAQRDAAVNAMKAHYGIPRSLRGYSRARQQAVGQMDGAMRRMVTARARQATAQQQLDAIRAQLKTAQGTAAKQYLAARLAAAQKLMDNANQSMTWAQQDFAGGLKTWQGH